MNSNRFRIGIGKTVGLAVGGVFFAGLFALVFGYLVMVLWNWLMPALFHLPAVGYWKAFGIVVLAKLVFGGFGPHGHDQRSFHPGHKRDWGWPGEGRDDWAPKGSCRNWRYYDQYWREEGKAAFEAYLDRLEKEKQQGQGQKEKV